MPTATGNTWIYRWSIVNTCNLLTHNFLGMPAYEVSMGQS